MRAVEVLSGKSISPVSRQGKARDNHIPRKLPLQRAQSFQGPCNRNRWWRLCCHQVNPQPLQLPPSWERHKIWNWGRCWTWEDGMFDENSGLTVVSEGCVKLNSVSMSMVVFQWLLSWLLHKWRERLSGTNLSSENNLPMFWLNAPVALMTTGAFSQNVSKLFSELKLVADNLPLCV